MFLLVVSPTNDMTIEVTNINYLTGEVTAIVATGTPVIGDTLAFYPSIAISAATSGSVLTVLLLFILQLLESSCIPRKPWTCSWR